MSKPLPRGIRNNNPGNIERGKDRWLGMSQDQSSDSRFLVFDTPEAGIRALMRVLINYQERYKIKTVRSAIQRWAPNTENNTLAYVQHVCRLTGFDPEEQLDFLDREVCVALTKAIIRHENGEPGLWGRKDWYDEATCERAAVMAGFEPVSKPLVRSRTITGGAVATVGAVVGVAVSGSPDIAATLPISPTETATIAATASAFGFQKVAEMLPHVVSLVGILYMVYARIDDARRKLR